MHAFYTHIMLVMVFLFVAIPALGQQGDSTGIEEMAIVDFLICEDVVEREPVNIRQSYSMSDERAWSFARLNNPGEMRRVYFKWYFEDEKYFEMDARIGSSPNWRTYSSVALQPGAWRVELHDDQDNILREVRFHVSE